MESFEEIARDVLHINDSGNIDEKKVINYIKAKLELIYRKGVNDGLDQSLTLIKIKRWNNIMSLEVQNLQEYVDYLENEIETMRDHITEQFDAFNSGSISEDVIGIIEMLDNK